MDSKPTIRLDSCGEMIDFAYCLDRPEYAPWKNELHNAVKTRANPDRHGDLLTWLNIVNTLPQATPSVVRYDTNAITVGAPEDLTTIDSKLVFEALKGLIPWRKGPYNVFGHYIDTEWRSDWKWQRVAPYIESLENKNVLDIGCGTGYHCWRMLGDGAKYVLGIDPSMRFCVQYLAMQRYLNDQRFDFLPIGIEDLPSGFRTFEAVFSMGILYHRRNPSQHIDELYSLTSPNGQTILETIVVADEYARNGVFYPEGRYSQMRNVWQLTTIDHTIDLLKQAGFIDVKCVDVNVTSTREQRQTEWMLFHSLEQFLDPHDHSKTVEGHPAPVRAVFTAKKPETSV